jgi:proteasome lid subunit RPN8/RPN11
VAEQTLPGGPYVVDGVREGICNHVFSSLEAEVGGVLVGRLRPDGSPRITSIIPALEAEGARSRVTFTHDAWSRIHEVLDREHPGEEILGWYHSHPGFGIFLSEHDLFIHRNFFSRPEQIAVVVDPHSGKEGVFAWRHGEIVKLHEGDTLRPGERPRAIEAGARPQRSVAAMGVYWLLGMLVGLLIWTAFLNDRSESRPTPGRARTAPAPTTESHAQARPPTQAGTLPPASE